MTCCSSKGIATPIGQVQPYLIALLTAKGTPLLSEGQEFCENYWIPSWGEGRVMLYRPVRWNYFYDTTASRSSAWCEN